jgi:hypothetical protein
MDLGGVTGIKIIQDTGVLSDHNMIISKIDLGIEKFKISTEKEERFEFRRIMNIPVVLKQGHDHPTFNEQVFHGADFLHNKNLYLRIQDIAGNPQFHFHDRISNVLETLEQLELSIIERTKSAITIEEQKIGKLVQRLPEDATCSNNASLQIFDIIRDICRNADLASMVSIFPVASLHKKKSRLLLKKK